MFVVCFDQMGCYFGDMWCIFRCYLVMDYCVYCVYFGGEYVGQLFMWFGGGYIKVYVFGLSIGNGFNWFQVLVYERVFVYK